MQSAQRQLLGDVATADRAGSAGWADGPNGNREQFRVGLATAAADADGWASVNYSVQRLVKADDGTVGTQYAAVAQGSVRLPASAAGNFATVVDREVNVLNGEDRAAAAARTAAWLEAATKAVPFGTLAVDLNDGKAGWATAGATLVDAAGLLTGAFAARGAGALRGASAAARAEARAAAVARLERWHAVGTGAREAVTELSAGQQIFKATNFGFATTGDVVETTYGGVLGWIPGLRRAKYPNAKIAYINPKLSGSIKELTLLHEGQHVRDFTALPQLTHLSTSSVPGRGIARFVLEYRAYGVGNPTGRSRLIATLMSVDDVRSRIYLPLELGAIGAGAGYGVYKITGD